MRAMMEDEYITVTEAAKILQVKHPVVRWLIRNGFVKKKAIMAKRLDREINQQCIGVSLFDIQQEKERKRTEGRRKPRSRYVNHPLSDGMLSVHDAAVKMGVSANTIYYMKRRKIIETHSIDNLRRSFAIADSDTQNIRNLRGRSNQLKAPPVGFVLFSAIAKHTGHSRQLIDYRYKKGKIAVAQELHYPNRLVVTQEEYDRVLREDTEKKARKLIG